MAFFVDFLYFKNTRQIMINTILIKDFFEGKVKLWKSYWLVGELLNGLVLLIIFNLEIYFFNANSSVSQIPFFNFSNLTFISKLTIFIWTIFISIGIWRSAENYKGNIFWIILTFIIVAYRCYSLRLIFFV